MQSKDYSLICGTSVKILEDLISEWWKNEDLHKKELIEDKLPKRLSVKYRRGHLLGESSIFVMIAVSERSGRSVLKIRVSQSDFARWSPKEELEKIVCWFHSSLSERNIEFEMKPGLFRSPIECK